MHTDHREDIGWSSKLSERVIKDVIERFAYMEKKRLVDLLCIEIEKIVETHEVVQYAFISNVYETNAKFCKRMMVVGQNRGVLQIAKDVGKVTLIETMPEDEDNKRFVRAAMKVRKHWEAGEFPNKTMVASG